MITVGIVLFEGFQPLDVVGPYDVFSGANEAVAATSPRRAQPYDVELVATSLAPVVGENGLSIVPTTTFADAPACELILVPGGVTLREKPGGALAQHLEQLASGVDRIAAVCTGTFLLATSGLITDHKVTTHWAWAGQLSRRFPDLDVDPDAIYVRDENVWTSAGVTAGIDLALALVEEDCGPSIAQLVARHLVVYLRRPGGQTQFSAPVWSDATELEPIREAKDIIHRAPEADLRISALAEAVGLSERHFTRLFKAEVGESPARYVDRVRVEAARTILETERVGLAVVAQRCGFQSAETLRRAFHRRLGVSPATYRRQSAPALAGTH